MTAAFLDFSLQVGLVLLSVALVLAALRAVLGPTLADRVLALDTLSVLAVGLLAVYALATGRFMLFDIALGLTAAGFLATVAFARFIRSRRPRDAGGEQSR